MISSQLETYYAVCGMRAGKIQTRVSSGIQGSAGRLDRTSSATPRAGGSATPTGTASAANLIDEQLQEAIESERLIDAELDELISVSGGSVLDAARTTLMPDGPVLQSIRVAMEGISALSEKTTETATLAERVSSKIRSLDVRQSRVREVLHYIDALDERKRSVEGVKRALETGDLGAAVGCVSQFFDSISEPSVAGGKGSDGAGRVGAERGTGQEVSERAETRQEDARGEMREMEEYRKQCEDRVRAAVEEAIASDDRAAVTMYCQMYGPLKLQKEGMRTLISYATKRIKMDAKEAYDALVDGFSLTGAKVTYVDALTNVLRDVAQAIDEYLDVMRDAFGPECALEGVHTLHGESDVWGARVMARYMEEKELGKFLEGHGGQGEEPGKKIDVSVLMELLVMCTRGEEYIKYVLQAMSDAAAPNALAPALETSVRGGPFGSSMREVLSYYISLEEVYVEESVAKAIEIDQTIAGSLTSSMVDDSFYVLLSAGKRALSTGRAPSAVAVLNQINTVLSTVYKSSLVRKLQGCPSKLAACAENAENVEAQGAANPYAIVMNDVDLSALYVEKLREQLEQVAHQVFFNALHDDDRIQMVLADLKKTSSDIKRLADQATEQLTTSLMLKMRHNLDAFVSASYEIVDAGFEISDQWSASLVQSFGRTFSWLQHVLTPDLYTRVVMSAVDKIVSRMEAAIAQKTFTQLGGLQLDKDVRALIIGLSELCEKSVRDRFGRLGQLATVLGVESVEEAADLIGDQLLSLSELDVKAALMKRADLPHSALAR